MKTYEGKLDATGLKFGIVISRYNEFITSKLLDGAIDCLRGTAAAKRVSKLPGFRELSRYPLLQK